MNLDTSIASCGLSSIELTLLRKANIQTIEDLVMTPLQDIAKRCKASQMDVKRVYDAVMKTLPLPETMRLDQLQGEDDIFTTGDEQLDSVLSGGIRTGMVWEVVGESAAGKTQFAMQMSLNVQLPPSSKGLSGSTCYLTTSSLLPTARLLQIAEESGLISSGCGLDDVHTITAPTVALLEHILSTTLPAFVNQLANDSTKKPARLLVVDALGELFHLSDKTTMSTLVERSKHIAAISASLHRLATTHKMAVLVLNEVIDVFHRPGQDETDYQGAMVYEKQAKWFNTATFFGDATKEAALGLSWANQINTRIMLSRTGRRRYLHDDEHPKRRQIGQPNATGQSAQQEQQGEPTLIRRLSVIFSSVSQPVSLDYIVSETGISILPNSVTTLDSLATQNMTDPPAAKVPSAATLPQTLSGQAPVAITEETPSSQPDELEQDEFADVWDRNPTYENFDWDALEQVLSQRKE